MRNGVASGCLDRVGHGMTAVELYALAGLFKRIALHDRNLYSHVCAYLVRRGNAVRPSLRNLAADHLMLYHLGASAAKFAKRQCIEELHIYHDLTGLMERSGEILALLEITGRLAAI